MKQVLGIVTPMWMEAGLIMGWRNWQQHGLLRIKMIRLDSGSDIFIVCSGIGADNTKEATRWLIQQEISVLAVLGVAGGLDPALSTGDLIIPHTIIQTDSSRVVILKDPFIEPIRSRLRQAGLPVRNGILLTREAPVLTLAEKSALYSAHGAGAVDMESGFAVQVAEEKRIPFFALRVICDAAETEVPEQLFRIMKNSGSIHWLYLFYTLFRQPLMFNRMIRLGLDSYRALFILRSAWRFLMAAPGLHVMGNET